MPTVNINQAPVPVLSIDLEDFHEMGITDQEKWDTNLALQGDF